MCISSPHCHSFKDITLYCCFPEPFHGKDKYVDVSCQKDICLHQLTFEIFHNLKSLFSETHNHVL